MSRTLKLFGLSASGGIAIAALSIVLALSNQKPACACRPDTHGIFLSSLLRSQQAFHVENGRLAQPQELEASKWQTPIADIGQSQTYSVETITQNGQDITLAYSVPKQTDFQSQIGPFKGKPQPTYHSAISAMIFNKATESFEAVTCTTKQPGSEKLSPPSYQNNGFNCPAGTEMSKPF